MEGGCYVQLCSAESLTRCLAPTLHVGGGADPIDETLVLQTLGGDETAFAALVKRYENLIWSTVRRFIWQRPDAEDVFQEVLIRIYTSLPAFNPKYSFHPWIKRITTNYCIDELRRKRAKRLRLWSEFERAEQEKLFGKLASGNEFDQLTEEDADRYEGIALAIIENLKPISRSALVMREIEGRDYFQISQSLGISEGNARARVCRARTEVIRRFRCHLSGVSLAD